MYCAFRDTFLDFDDLVIINRPQLSDSQANAKLKCQAQKGEHYTRTAEVPSSIITRGNILLLDFFFVSHGKASDANIANFVHFVKTPFVLKGQQCRQLPQSISVRTIEMAVAETFSHRVYCHRIIL